jgi:hypothetical protein
MGERNSPKAPVVEENRVCPHHHFLHKLVPIFKQSKITEKCTQIDFKIFFREDTRGQTRKNLFLENKLYYISPAVIYFWILFLMNL